MIATMAVNMPQLDDDCRTTLVVVPAALLQQVCNDTVPHMYILILVQWKDEIDTKSNGIFTVHVHHGRDKLKVLQYLYVQNLECSFHYSENI